MAVLLRRGWRFRRASPEALPEPESPASDPVTTPVAAGPPSEPAPVERAATTPTEAASIPRRWRRVALAMAVICASLLVGGGTAAFANDAFTRERLLRGTRIGGVYIGGDTVSEAQQKLTRRFVDPLRQPIVINAADVTTETTPWDLGLRLDVQSLLQRTYDRQQHMNIWQRLVAWARGDKDANPSVAPLLDQGILKRTITDIERRVSRPVQNASLSFAGGRLLIVPDRTGRNLDAADALKRVTAAVSNGAGHVGLPVKLTYAQHRTSDFARVVVVRGGSNVLDLYENGALAHSYRVATGTAAYPTPLGQFYVIGKQRNPAWINPNSSWSVGMPAYVPPGPNNPLGTRAIQLDANAIYIHGTPNAASIGTHASHGCIRMRMSEAEDFYERVRVGTPVLIVPD